ncbi:hypothetical protein QBC44DRAFT_376359 [Cladorrhinum sp. PSN332]|nr:hypothetical protein QBC44DRAFT_376359 [Cladorrhinum sp. PSN332]
MTEQACSNEVTEATIKIKAPAVPRDEASTSELGEMNKNNTQPSPPGAFAVSIQDINLNLTVYAIFHAVAPGIFASLADTTGRRPVLLGLVAPYAVASLGLAPNRNNKYAVLIALRAVQSIGAVSVLRSVDAVEPHCQRVAGRHLSGQLEQCMLPAVGGILLHFLFSSASPGCDRSG